MSAKPQIIRVNPDTPSFLDRYDRDRTNATAIELAKGFCSDDRGGSRSVNQRLASTVCCS